MRHRWSGNDEPPLDEVLADPLIHLVMARSGVAMDELLAIVTRARCLLRHRLCRRIAA